MNTNMNTDNIKNVSQEEFLRIMQENIIDNKKSRDLGKQLREYIKDVSKNVLNEAPEIKTGIIRYNDNDKNIKVEFLDSITDDNDENFLWTVKNESVYRNLKEGTIVKVIFQKKNKYNNCWIIGVNDGTKQQTIEDVIKNNELYFYNQYIQVLQSEIEQLKNMIDVLMDLACQRLSVASNTDKDGNISYSINAQPDNVTKKKLEQEWNDTIAQCKNTLEIPPDNSMYRKIYNDFMK